MTDLTALIERVEKCTAPDREVDAVLFQNFTVNERIAPLYTASLDAVVALIEQAMPDALWEVNGYGSAHVLPHWADGDAEDRYSETNKKPHIALLLAFLRAKNAASSALKGSNHE